MADVSDRPAVTDDAEMVEIRQQYTYAVDEKREIREEGDTDMRYISGNAWNPKDRKAREDANRPCLDLDELGQYVNQLINDVRQNKRGIKAAPEGAGATDKTADLRQSLIRQIEYRSNASLSAYPVMFENAAQRGYGYLRITAEYADHQSFDQELRIRPIANPNMVVEDPHAQEADGSDWKYLFFCESWSKEDFKAKWGNKVKFQSFDVEATRLAPDWVKGGRILVAERWRVVTRPRKLLLVQKPPMPGQQPERPSSIFEDELDLGKLPLGAKMLKDRMVDYPTVKQQLTNGLEILEENDVPGLGIPFVACYGKILYLDNDGGPKKHLLSLIRLARNPQMLYNYYRTAGAEVVGRVPKVTPVGYTGQFDGHETDWQESYHIPKAYLEVNATTDATGGTLLPIPQMQTWEPPIQALEMGAEAARRAIQSAIGASPLPTSAQRRNEKSGVALQTMEDSAQKGSFHFVDHFDGAMVRTGQLLEERIKFYYDAARDITVRKPDDQPSVIRINDPSHPESVSATEGKHDITLSVGPRQISEREAASDFADSILGSSVMQMLEPAQRNQIIALAIRLKSVGPIGDEMADVISPKPKDGQPSPQDVQKLQQQVQELTKQLQAATQAAEGEQAKQQATLQKTQLETQSREKIAAAQLSQKDNESRADNETRLAVAELGAKMERIALFLEERARLGVQAHEADQAEQDRQHEAAMSAVGQGASAGGQVADQQHAQEMAAQAAEQQRQAAMQQEAG